MVHHGTNLVRASGRDLRPPKARTSRWCGVTSFGASAGPPKWRFSESERTPWCCFCWRNYRTSPIIHTPAGAAARAGPYRLVKALSTTIRSRGSGAGLQRFLPLLSGGLLESVARTGAGRHHRPGPPTRTLCGAQHHHLSAHPQDTKIAVACRDGGQCTHVDGWIGRCPETTNLHYDHLRSVQARWAPRDVEPHAVVR